MAWWRREKRDATMTQNATSEQLVQFFGLHSLNATGETVTIESALGVPAVWAAVNFLAGTLAGIPLHVYQNTRKGRVKVSGGLAAILHDAPNGETSSFEWRKHGFEQAFTGGRWVSFIDRNAAGAVLDIVTLDPAHLTIKREGGRKVYYYKDGGKGIKYGAEDVIDMPFMLKADALGHRSPIIANRDAIGLAQAVTKYGGKFFANGGVPPFAITGAFQSSQAMKRAGDDMDAAVKKAAADNRQALVLPTGLDIKQIGADAEKSQMTETKRFVIEEVARIYSLPPTFLQDLTHGTFSNTEQQDLHFVKHTLKRWVEQFEQELNLKLFGRGNSKFLVEMNLDGMLRGDFATRMSGYATAIQNAVMTPNEARALENRPEDSDGNMLMIQGATVPIKNQAAPPEPPKAEPPADETGTEDDLDGA
jgi:HK97 family phage portal protein